MRDSSELKRDEEGLVKSLPWYIRLFAVFFKVINREVYVEEVTTLNAKLENIELNNINLKNKIDNMITDSKELKEANDEILEQKDQKIIELNKEIEKLKAEPADEPEPEKPVCTYRKNGFRKKEVIDIFNRVKDLKEEVVAVAKHYNVAPSKINDILNGKLYIRFGVYHKYNKK